MNLEELENKLILYGSDISKWEDAEAKKLAENHIKKTKSAQELVSKYNMLDKKLDSLGDVSPPDDIQEKILSKINEDEYINSNNIFLIFTPRYFVPVLSLLFVVLLSVNMFKGDAEPSEDQVYSYAMQVLDEMQTEQEIESIEDEAASYEEMINLI